MYTNGSCTLFLASMNYQKIVISKAFTTKRSLYEQSKLGLSYTENAFSMFKGHTDLTGKFTEGKDFLVKGTSNITVDVSDTEKKKNTLTNIKNAGGTTIMQADYKDYGSAGMRHWELSCR